MNTINGLLLLDADVPLTPCEFALCHELVKTTLGLKEIAAKLGKSTKTANVQATSAYRKLGVKSRLELIQRFHNGKEIRVSHISAREAVLGITQRLDEIENKLDYLLAQRQISREGRPRPALIS